MDGRPQYAIEANLKGFLGAAYSLGAILSLPFVPYVNQRVGRRWTIMFGSCVSLIGAIIQGFSNGGIYPLTDHFFDFSDSSQWPCTLSRVLFWDSEFRSASWQGHLYWENWVTLRNDQFSPRCSTLPTSSARSSQHPWVWGQ